MNVKTINLKIFIILTLSGLIFSCNSAYEVTKLSDIMTIENGIIYNLPKTALNITVEVEEIHKIKGPFSKYAGKFFGTTDAVKSNTTEYKIAKIVFETGAITDPSNFYIIKPKKNSPAGFVSLTANGFIVAVNSENYKSENFNQVNEINLKTRRNDIPKYAELSVLSIREEKFDTLYKEVFQDSVYVKLPVIKKKTVYKSEEKQAEELAEQIFLLRDDKLALMKGENDGSKQIEGAALAIMINELNKIEQEYTSLFTGITDTLQRFYNFVYIPEKEDLSEEKTIFNFSTYYGVLPHGRNDGTPVILRLISENNFSNSKYTIDSKNSGFIYRIPENATAEIIYDGRIVARKKIKISQFGVLKSLPKDIIDDDIKIEFYPEYGSIKNISKINNDDD